MSWLENNTSFKKIFGNEKRSPGHHTILSARQGKGKHCERWPWELSPHSGQGGSASVQLEGEADLESGTFTSTRWGFHVTGVRVPVIPITSCGVPSGAETPSRTETK